MTRLRPLSPLGTLLDLWEQLQERFREFNDTPTSFDGNMSGGRITNLGDASLKTDAVSVQYGDSRWARRGELTGAAGPAGPAGPPGTGLTPWVPITAAGTSLTLNMASGHRQVVTVNVAVLDLAAPTGLVDNGQWEVRMHFTVDCDVTMNAAWPLPTHSNTFTGAAGSKGLMVYDVIGGALFLSRFEGII